LDQIAVDVSSSVILVVIIKYMSVSEPSVLEEKPAHHPLEPLDVTLKHTGLDAAYLLSTRD
jgi:hypothetical protein